MGMLIRNKNITFSLILMCLMVVSPMAKAQLGGLLDMNVNVVNMQGRLMCSIDGRVSTINPISTPPLAGAPVMLQCVGQNVANTTTGPDGVFSFPLNPVATSFLSEIMSDGCSAMVMTPLSRCNPSLPNRPLTVRMGLVTVVVSPGMNMMVFRELVTPLS